MLERLMWLTPKRVRVLLLGVFASICALLVVDGLVRRDWIELLGAGVGALGLSILTIAEYRGWRWSGAIAVVMMSALVVGFTTEPYLTQQFSLSIFIPIVLSAILLKPRWVILTWLGIAAALVAQAGLAAIVIQPQNVALVAMIVCGIALASWLARTQQEQAEAAQAETNRVRAIVEARAGELAEANQRMNAQLDQQQQLLDLVATLETPAVPLAEGVLFAPIVGHMDTRRAQALTNRLLQDASAQRSHMVVLDITGVTVIDTSVAQALLNTARALRLLGCEVTISGISATVAMTLIHLGVNLNEVHTARSPQEALAQYLGTMPLKVKSNGPATFN